MKSLRKNTMKWSMTLNSEETKHVGKGGGVSRWCFKKIFLGNNRNREPKFKRALRVHFLTHFTKNFCHFLTPKVKSGTGTDMINPSIESFDFLFWHEKIWSWIFKNFVGNRQSTFHEFKFSVCLHTP